MEVKISDDARKLIANPETRKELYKAASRFGGTVKTEVSSYTVTTATGTLIPGNPITSPSQKRSREE